MAHKPLSRWSHPPRETPLPPKPGTGQPWKRRYRLRDVGGNRRGSMVIASEDAPAGDPDVRRFWNWVAILLVFIALGIVLTSGYDLLT